MDHTLLLLQTKSKYKRWFTFNFCETTIINNLSSLFLALAVLLNIKRWIYFALLIQSDINIQEHSCKEIVAEEREDLIE